MRFAQYSAGVCGYVAALLALLVVTLPSIGWANFSVVGIEREIFATYASRLEFNPIESDEMTLVGPATFGHWDDSIQLDFDDDFGSNILAYADQSSEVGLDGDGRLQISSSGLVLNSVLIGDAGFDDSFNFALSFSALQVHIESDEPILVEASGTLLSNLTNDLDFQGFVDNFLYSVDVSICDPERCNILGLASDTTDNGSGVTEEIGEPVIVPPGVYTIRVIAGAVGEVHEAAAVSGITGWNVDLTLGPVPEPNIQLLAVAALLVLAGLKRLGARNYSAAKRFSSTAVGPRYVC